MWITLKTVKSTDSMGLVSQDDIVYFFVQFF